jgi:imidazolonepropionase-like amidohydrolase
MCAITDEAERLNVRVAAHAHGAPGVRNVIRARVTTIYRLGLGQSAK